MVPFVRHWLCWRGFAVAALILLSHSKANFSVAKSQFCCVQFMVGEHIHKIYCSAITSYNNLTLQGKFHRNANEFKTYLRNTDNKKHW